MKADKLRGMDSAELETQLADMTGQLFRLRFQMSMGQMDGLKKYRALKKDRARVLTILRERELAEEAEAGARVGKE
jgi:large subunit ribosomal protein L29